MRVTADPKEVGPVDIVLFAVKLWDTETAAELAKPMVGPQTRVITFQNGVDSVERLAPILGADHVAGGSAYIASVIASPGVISHTSQFARMLCGRIDRKPDAQLQAFVKAAKDAGLDVTLADDIDRERWQKFVFLVGLSGATGAMRSSLGPILADPDTRAFFRSLMAEVIAVGRARGVALDADYLEDRMKFADAAPAGMKASLLHDLERGNRIEIDWLAGKVAALGRELGIPTPANAAVYAMLKLHRMGTK